MLAVCRDRYSWLHIVGCCDSAVAIKHSNVHSLSSLVWAELGHSRDDERAIRCGVKMPGSDSALECRAIRTQTLAHINPSWLYTFSTYCGCGCEMCRAVVKCVEQVKSVQVSRTKKNSTGQDSRLRCFS